MGWTLEGSNLPGYGNRVTRGDLTRPMILMLRIAMAMTHQWLRSRAAAAHRIFKKGVPEWKSLPIVLRRRLLIGVFVVGGLDLLILTYEPLLTWSAYLFRAEDSSVQSDAIVILLGNSYDRSSRAAELYRQGLAPIILMGRTVADVSFDDEIERHRQILMRGGVPADAIRVLPGEVVKNTHDEALRVQDYVRTHPVRRITVVTTAYHTARTRWTFRRVLGGLEVEVRMAASEDPRFTEANWYLNGDGIKMYISELFKFTYYRIAY
jgi:uncharacterized SAM-binding protein YcdF (DUF218 family)